MEGAAPSAPVAPRFRTPFNRRRRSGALHRFARAGQRMVVLMLFDRVDARPFEMESVRRASARGAHGRGRAAVAAATRRSGSSSPPASSCLVRDLRRRLRALRRRRQRQRAARRCCRIQVLFRDLPGREQRVFRAMQEGVDRGGAAARRRAAPGRRSRRSPATGIPPFAPDVLDKSALRWSSGATGSSRTISASRARPADMPGVPDPRRRSPTRAPARSPAPAVVDEEHQLLPDGTLLHVTYWKRRARARRPRRDRRSGARGLAADPRAAARSRADGGTMRRAAIALRRRGSSCCRVRASRRREPHRRRARSPLQGRRDAAPVLLVDQRTSSRDTDVEVRADPARRGRRRRLPAASRGHQEDRRPRRDRRQRRRPRRLHLRHDQGVGERRRSSIIRPNDGVPLLKAANGGTVNSHTFISFSNAIQQTYAIAKALVGAAARRSPTTFQTERRRLRAAAARHQEQGGGAAGRRARSTASSPCTTATAT